MHFLKSCSFLNKLWFLFKQLVFLERMKKEHTIFQLFRLFVLFCCPYVWLKCLDIVPRTDVKGRGFVVKTQVLLQYCQIHFVFEPILSNIVYDFLHYFHLFLLRFLCVTLQHFFDLASVHRFLANFQCSFIPPNWQAHFICLIAFSIFQQLINN